MNKFVVFIALFLLLCLLCRLRLIGRKSILQTILATLAFYSVFIICIAVGAIVCPFARLLFGHITAKRVHEYVVGTIVVKWMVLLGFWSFSIKGQPPKDLSKAFMIICNHTSIIDTCLLCHIPISKKYLTKSSYFNIPVFGWTQRVVGDIGVDLRYVLFIAMMVTPHFSTALFLQHRKIEGFVQEELC
jgi:1-acyl-sn-glycerol-3-phosphate acyltransferase